MGQGALQHMDDLELQHWLRQVTFARHLPSASPSRLCSSPLPSGSPPRSLRGNLLSIHGFGHHDLKNSWLHSALPRCHS